MPLVDTINLSSINSGDPQKQLQSVVAQLNEWAHTISNETRADVYKDNSGTDRIIIGVLPDNSTGIVISKEGSSVLNVFD